MKSTRLSTNKLDLRLAAYAAAGVALAAPAITPSAQADIVYSGPLNLAVPNTLNGIYLDLATGATSTSFFSGYDINPYGTDTNGLVFLGAIGAGFFAPTTASPASALLPGTSIGPADVFTTAFSGVNFHVTGTEFFGLQFVNSNTGGTDYGWIQFQTTAATGFPATILGYAYNNVAGGAILAGQTTAVPEPGTTAALGFGALSLGAAGVRRWRKARQAVA